MKTELINLKEKNNVEYKIKTLCENVLLNVKEHSKDYKDFIEQIKNIGFEITSIETVNYLGEETSDKTEIFNLYYYLCDYMFKQEIDKKQIEYIMTLKRKLLTPTCKTYLI